MFDDKDKAKPHAGAHRPLHPNPTSKREVLACRCQGCGTDVSDVAQSLCESYDRIEIPKMQGDLRDAGFFIWRRLPMLRQALQGRTAGRVGAGVAVRAENLRAFVVYLRSVRGFPWRD